MQPFGEAKLDAAEIEQTEFDTGFRGYDQTSVRQYLRKLAATVRSVERASGEAAERVAELEKQNATLSREIAELRDAASQSEVDRQGASAVVISDLDDDEITRLVGEETTRVLTSAKQAGHDIVARAEAKAAAIDAAAEEAKAIADAEVAALRSEVAQEVAAAREAAEADSLETRQKATAAAAEISETADQLLANTTEEAHQKATQIVATAQTEADETRRVAAQDAEGAKQAADDLRRNAEKVAEAIRAEAAADSEAAQDAAREHARSMLVEAQSVREKVLSDLVQRRRVARQQLDGAKAARDRLSRSMAIVRQQMDEAATELQLSVPEARVAMETIARRENAAEDEQDVINLARELDAGVPERIAAEPPKRAVPAAAEEPEPAAAHSPGLAEPEAAEPEVAEPEVAEADIASDTGTDDATLDVADDEPTDLTETAGAETQDLDDIFARIRTTEKPKKRAARGAAAVVVPLASEPSEPPADEEQAAPSEPVPDEPAPPGVFMDRDVAMTRLGPDVRRHLKRAVADDQSDVLDRLRSGKGNPSVDELAPKQKLVVMVIDALTPGLTKAAERGSNAIGGTGGTDITELVERLAMQLVDPFRTRLEAILERGESDRDEILEPVRSLYRDLRATELSAVADDGLVEAFAHGLYDAIDDESDVHWVTDPRVSHGADCHDNTLAGPITKGSEFPTGHRLPLVEPGCRCLVVPSSYEA